MNNTNTTNRILLRRLTQLSQQQQQLSFQMQPPHQQTSLKCPRCDSLNTKFCYYNNYNLSQPRHFCKNCRRYWTKGGVLRNVPVGGGCRKSKRSSKINKQSFNNNSVSTVTETVVNSVSNNVNSNGHNSHSSSDSTGSLFQIPDVENFNLIDGFMGNINNNEGNNNINTASFNEYLQSEGVLCGGVHEVNRTDRIEDLLQSRGSNVGLATLDWNLTAGNENQGCLFDVPDDSSTVDHHHHHHHHDQGYWSQSTVDNHLPLFLP